MGSRRWLTAERSLRLKRIRAFREEIERKHREGQPLWSPGGLAEAERIFDELEHARKEANTLALPDD